MDLCDDIWILLLCLLQTLYTVAPLTLHIAGVHLIKKCSTYPPQQRLYLIQISIIEIIFLLINNDCLVYMEVYQFLPRMASYLQLFIKASLAIPWCNVMIFLTVDRVAQVWLNIKYERYVTTFRTRLLIMGAWGVGVGLFISMVIATLVTHLDALSIVHFHITQVFMGLVVVSLVPCYIYLCIQIKKIKRKDKRSGNNHSPDHITVKIYYFVPLWIILTYIVTFLLPNILQIVFKQVRYGVTCYFYIIAQFLFISGCLGDALVYILMDTRMRKRFLTDIGWVKEKKVHTPLLHVRNCQSDLND